MISKQPRGPIVGVERSLPPSGYRVPGVYTSRQGLNLRRLYTILLIVVFAIAPQFALSDDNRNLMLIAVMATTPLVILIEGRLSASQVPLLLFMGLAIAIPLITHPSSFRWSTVLYSTMFCSAFIAYEQLLRKGALTPELFMTIVRWLLYAYVVILLIQQFCVLVGFPILNASNYSSENPWKLNSLAAEPSHTARIVALLMFTYTSVSELCRGRKYDLKADFRSDLLVWLGFLWTMVSIRSATAYVFIPIIFLKLMNRSNYFLSLFLILIVFAVTLTLDITEYQRSIDLLIAVARFDPVGAMQADHSGSLRVVPMMILSTMVDVSSFDGLFGHGIDTVSDFMSAYVFGVQENYAGGGLLRVWYEYGFVLFLIYVAFTLGKLSPWRAPLHLVFWALLVFMVGVNNQITWLCMMLLWTLNYFRARYGSARTTRFRGRQAAGI